MHISLNWLKEYLDLGDISVDDLCQKMTMLGLEIEAVERPGDDITEVYVGQILSLEPHPDADKLVVCKTDVGFDAPRQIVCGAKNMKVGDKVPTAVVGATLPGDFQIARRKMRGVESQGMMCSASELGLGEDHSGLMILDEDTPIGLDAKQLLGLDDVILEIEVTPNRGDWASMLGVARELAAALGVTYKTPAVQLNESAEEATSKSSVVIEAPDLCPRYIGRVLTDVKVKKSPAWLCQRLVAAGQRPINNIVDVTNYVLLETGHPLHAFDYDKLDENRIVVRRAKPGETMQTLDGEKRTLADDMLVIADASQPVALAGVMGGEDSEVSGDTTTIFLESAWFSPPSIRKTARAHNMHTEASMRFQRGADIDMAAYAVDRAAALMAELADASVCAGQIDEYPQPPEPSHVTLRYDRANLLLGTNVPRDTQRDILVALGFTLIASDETSCTVSVPSWRHDVTLEADLIEEVARLYGYENIDITLPTVRQNETDLHTEGKRIEEIRASLVAQGLTETFNWTFSSVDDVQKAGLPNDYETMVTLQNPLSEQYATMQSSLIPGLLKTVSTNVRHGRRDVQVFELNPVYIPVENEVLPAQRTKLGIALTGHTTEKHWGTSQETLNFFDLKGIAETLTETFAVDLTFEAGEWGPLQKGQCAQLLANGNAVGWMGEVRPDILAKYDVEQPVYILEIDTEPFLRDITPARFEPIPAFPPAHRDLAVIVDKTLPAGDLIQITQKAGGKLLQQVKVFDIYVGNSIPAGKKSVALSLQFQSFERTLKDKETQKACDKILKTLETEFGAQLR